MRAGSSRFIFAIAFALALAAGVAAGVLATRFSSFQVAPPPSTLEDLQLTGAQRGQIQKIWEGVKELSDQSYDQANQLQQHLNQKTQALLTPEQKDQYAGFYKEYQRQFLKLQSDRDAAVKKAIEDTKTLLSDDQRQKYDVILKSRLGRPGGTLPSTVDPSDMPRTAANKPGGSEF